MKTELMLDYDGNCSRSVMEMIAQESFLLGISLTTMQLIYIEQKIGITQRTIISQTISPKTKSTL